MLCQGSEKKALPKEHDLDPCTPIQRIDFYMLLVRWGVILTSAIVYVVTGIYGAVMVPPLVALLSVITYNIPISAYVMRKDYLLPRRDRQVIFAADLVQATLAVAVTGGHYSFFFFLFLLVIVEAALFYRWSVSLALVAISDALQLISTTFNQSAIYGGVSGPIIVVRFTALLIVGIIAIMFSELMRREDALRHQANISAQRALTLNKLFMRLGESSMNLEGILSVLVESASSTLKALCSLIILSEPDAGRWKVAASSTRLHHIDETVDGCNTESEQAEVVVLSADKGSFPNFVEDKKIKQLVCVRMSYHTGELLGWIVIGRAANTPISPDEETFLRSLALEAGLAIHNSRLYSQELEQIKQLEQFKDLRSVFFSAVGHELKTPLTVLKTLAPNLYRLPELPDGTRKEILDTIEQNLVRLEMLTSEMLDSARLEAGAVKLYRSHVDLEATTRKVLNSLKPMLDHQKIKVRVEKQGGLPTVMADRRGVEQILSNLLNNAVKFSPQAGTIEVNFSTSGNGIVTCVSDAGPGVPPEERERVFDKFYTSSNEQAFIGVGLGLFICREMVKLHGGKIWVEDSELGGSKFCFTLPMEGK